ncbi:putative quinol monooxygenase [Luteibaculum oceani]|nr:antibiotic biosynthesis monooxygenase family protein [Luteibaculum oceani]
MEFKPECVQDFLEMFAAKKSAIRSSKGCMGLKLLQEKSEGNTFFTYSEWKSEDDLERYRNSELFKSTWAQTKQWFNAKPAAWSVEINQEAN